MSDPAETPRGGQSIWKRLVMGRNLRVTLIRSAITAVILVGLFKFVLRPAVTDGISMVPTIHTHRLHFINLLSYRHGAPQRWDIVAIRGKGRNILYLKRILGLPGEVIEFRRGHLIINGSLLEEPYILEGGHWDMDPVILRDDQFFVAGDNRSMDMRRHLAGVTEQIWIEGRLLW